MSDERLRRLHRRFRETGDPEDEAAWLIARVRAGDLSRDQLALAVTCAHPAALRANRELERPVPAEVLWSVSWEQALAQTPELLLRVVVAMASDVLTRQVAELPAAKRAVAAAAGVLPHLPTAPAPDELTALRMLRSQADAEARRLDPVSHIREHYAVRATASALDAAIALLHRSAPRALAAASEAISAALGAGFHADGRKEPGHEQALLDAIGRDVIPWVLGDLDPLKD